MLEHNNYVEKTFVDIISKFVDSWNQRNFARCILVDNKDSIELQCTLSWVYRCASAIKRFFTKHFVEMDGPSIFIWGDSQGHFVNITIGGPNWRLHTSTLFIIDIDTWNDIDNQE
jgi:hypothetical protein